jgi:PhzF family phenazine biosynthesis protein
MALSETAFLVPKGEGYQLRWFTPKTEVELCGHATLAPARIFSMSLVFTNRMKLSNSNQSGLITASFLRGTIELDMPRRDPTLVPVSVELTAALDLKPISAAIYKDQVIIAELENATRSATLCRTSRKLQLCSIRT